MAETKRHITIRGLFDSIFHRPQMKAVNGYFSTFTSYAPSFSTWTGGLYEAELTRSAIESGAEHASKLKPEISGTAKARATKSLALQPNPWMTTPQFIKRVWTILQVCDTCIIVPVLDADMLQVGYYPVLPSKCTAYDVQGELWLQLQFPNGKTTLVEWSSVGVMTRHQYKSDLFGDPSHDVLKPTLDLIAMQSQAEAEAIKQGAQVRFIGKFSQNLSPDDMREKQREFNRQNLSAENNGGIAVYDRLFESVTPVTPNSYTVDSAQMQRIEKSVYRYFGTNEDIVLNKATEDVFNSYYEGRIEPFAVQLGAALTCMTYSRYEIANHNEITFSANRLEFASNKTKLDVATALFDRGIWSGNDVADVFQTAHYDGGEKHVIRGEYIDLDLISEHTTDEAASAAQTNSLIDQMGNKKEVDNDASKA